MKKTFRRTLKVKMFIVVVLGLILSVGVFFVGMFGFDRYVEDVYMSDANVQQRSMKQIQSFAAYVNSHSMKATDSRALRAWQEQHPNVYILGDREKGGIQICHNQFRDWGDGYSYSG